ncbi:MAG: lantibiotic dehydratase [Mucilaginibacter sp.]|uniref:lantibiotic dehydratase n=1 Tax=Mucilaginibacter sp. TaxID=1882438 RepID=UPI0032675D40
MKHEYYPYLILRTPVFPLRNILTDEPPDFINDPLFKEALYLASPDVAAMIYHQKAAIEGTLSSTITKYFNRMCFRCTPFGLFAGCAVVTWDYHSKIRMDHENIIRRSRPDKSYLAKLLDIFNHTPAIFRHLNIRINNTIYQVGQEFRMIEKGLTEGDFNITAIASDRVLETFTRLIGPTWKSIADICSESKKMGFSAKETMQYLRHLLDNQVISTHLDIAISNNELLDHWIAEFTRLEQTHQNEAIRGWRSYLTAFRHRLSLMDQSTAGNQEGIDQLHKLVATSGELHPQNRLFQVDHCYAGITGTLSYRVQKNLNKAIDILKKISSAGVNNHTLTSFKQRFLTKYEQQEIPLLLALDPETGIDFLENETSFDDFLSREIAMGAVRPRASPVLNFNLKLIQQKYEDAVAAGQTVITLTDQDIAHMESYPITMPVTSSVFFRILAGDNLQIENVGGSSGINLFARFTDFHPLMNEMARELAAIEQQIHGDHTVLAELLHEPEPRAGNVMAHLSFRQYDIPYYANSPRGDHEIITLDDILLSVRNGKFILRSKRLNTQVRPVISSAYNYTKGSPIYRFLGTLQNEDSDNLLFDFNAILPGKSFYPRLVYNELVFSPARWQIQYKALTNAVTPIDPDTIRQFLKNKGVPNLFTISEGDNELLIDTGKDILVGLFEEQLRKRKSLEVKEFLLTPENYPIVDEQHQALNNQAVAILINRYRQPIINAGQYPGQMKVTERKFTIGSEWLYYKIYSGIISSDKILSGHILKLITELKKLKLITHAFFIRYHDPDPHIRLRFHLNHLADLQKVISHVRAQLLEPERSGLIWKIQMDTYMRELERYGIAMEESEQLFYHDSIAILKLMTSHVLHENPGHRLAAGIRLADDLINFFFNDNKEKLHFIRHAKHLLKMNVGLDSAADKMINKSYREHAETYLQFLQMNRTSLEKIFTGRMKAVTKVMGPLLQGTINSARPEYARDLLGSYIHMTANRLFAANQKIYEYIIYDYLFKYYTKIEHLK